MNRFASVAHAVKGTVTRAVGLPDTQAGEVELAIMRIEASAHDARIKA